MKKVMNEKEELGRFELYWGAGSAGLVTGVEQREVAAHVPKVCGVGLGGWGWGRWERKGLGVRL